MFRAFMPAFFWQEVLTLKSNQQACRTTSFMNLVCMPQSDKSGFTQNSKRHIVRPRWITNAMDGSLPATKENDAKDGWFLFFYAPFLVDQ